jgi:hypothetical protein
MKSIARSALGIVLPIGLLVLGMLADRALHRHGQAPPPPPVAQDDPDDDEDLEGAVMNDSALELYAEITAACAVPDSIPVCAPRRFDARFADRLRALDPTGRKFERRWLADLWAGDHVAAYGLGWLRSQRALPALRQRLLTERYFHAWETSRPDAAESLYADAHFPRHQVLILAIERIEGRPIRKLIQLNAGERHLLWRRAASCEGAPAAMWLLHQFDGVPLPGAAANRERRIRCDAPR